MKGKALECHNFISKKKQSVQLSFFSRFVSNDRASVSNTLEAWENVPKYFFSPAMTNSLRMKNGLANPFTWEYIYKGSAFSVVIHPASLLQKDGSFKSFFPGKTEEIIEEVLKKIFVLQGHGLHIANEKESWVSFSLGMIYRELKKRKVSRNRNEIKQAIKIMSLSVITIKKEGKEIWSGAIIQDLYTVGRKEYEMDPDSLHKARLPSLVSEDINNLEYRQYNYDRMWKFRGRMALWLYKKLINRYTYAKMTNGYHFLFSDLKNSGLLRYKRERENCKKVLNALDELVKHGVLRTYKCTRSSGPDGFDIKYDVIADRHFVAEQKAANKRLSDNRIDISEQSGK